MERIGGRLDEDRDALDAGVLARQHAIKSQPSRRRKDEGGLLRLHPAAIVQHAVHRRAGDPGKLRDVGDDRLARHGPRFLSVLIENHQNGAVESRCFALAFKQSQRWTCRPAERNLGEAAHEGHFDRDRALLLGRRRRPQPEPASVGTGVRRGGRRRLPGTGTRTLTAMCRSTSNASERGLRRGTCTSSPERFSTTSSRRRTGRTCFARPTRFAPSSRAFRRSRASNGSASPRPISPSWTGVT